MSKARIVIPALNRSESQGGFRPAVTENAFRREFAKAQGNGWTLVDMFRTTHAQLNKIIDELGLVRKHKCKHCGFMFIPSNPHQHYHPVCKDLAQLHRRRMSWKVFNSTARIRKFNGGIGIPVKIGKERFEEIKVMPCFYGGKFCACTIITVERLNPLLPYEEGNVVASCADHNSAKAVIDSMVHRGLIKGEDAVKAFRKMCRDVAKEHAAEFKAWKEAQQ